MAEALDPNLRGLIQVLAALLVRELEREMAEASEEIEPDSEDDDDKSIRRRRER